MDKVGLALLFPKTDVVLPSLWEQVNGDAGRNWAVRDAEGGFVEWTAEMGFLWGAKDELPALGLVCVGKHVARVATCVAPRLVPTLVAASEPYEPESLELELVEAITVEGPLTGPALGAIAHDLLARKWKVPKRLPPREEARRDLARLFLASAGEVTAADLSPLGWRRKEAAAVLDEIADGHDDPGGFRIWRRR